MKLADSLKLSINSIAHRRLRAWLTLLGIIIGVAAIVAIISIGQGAQANVNARLASFGADIINLSAGGQRAGFFGGNFRFAAGAFGELGGGGGQRTARGTTTQKEPVLTKTDATIMRGNPGIKLVNEVVSGGRTPVTFMGEQAKAGVNGENPVTWPQMSNLTIASGRFLAPSDTSAVVIGDRLANSTFKEQIIPGKKIMVNDRPFTVVGILQPSISSGFGGGGDNVVYMTFSDAWTVTDVNKDTFSSIQAQVKDVSAIDDTIASLTSQLVVERRVSANNEDFTITSSEAIKQQIEAVTQSLTLFLGAIAAISLLVGAIGVANSMFTSVLEKTREIGIMKALGSTDNEILTLFIIESGMFGFIGGLIGAIFGTMVSSAIPALGIGATPGGGFTTLVTPELFIFAVVLSTIVGVVSGAVPAKNASNLKPVEALRYE